jgi:hypothetical protein
MAEHKTRMSDSSLYDEVCTGCGVTDADGPITGECPRPRTEEPTDVAGANHLRPAGDQRPAG